MIAQVWNGLDLLVSHFASPNKFFSHGLGDRKFLESMPERDAGNAGGVELLWNDETILKRSVRKTGYFVSPCDWLPPESRRGDVELLLPDKYNEDTPIFIHFAATGDETTVPRRILLAEPLLKDGIASLILVNPSYGTRRANHQADFVMKTVSDQFAMNQATIFEGAGLVKSLRAMGFNRIGVTGVSMGGSMAASVAASSPLEVRVAACIAPVGPAPAFCYGALSRRVDWEALGQEFYGASPLNIAGLKRKLVRVMSFADLRNHRPPVNSKLAILVGAKNDGYVPMRSVDALHRHWKGSEMRWLEGGHVSAVLSNSGDFRRAIYDVAFRAA
jgi:hypothetical protein